LPAHVSQASALVSVPELVLAAQPDPDFEAQNFPAPVRGLVADEQNFRAKASFAAAAAPSFE
jgi:hypothetical protein